MSPILCLQCSLYKLLFSKINCYKIFLKVEIQLIGPFPYKKKRSVYVIASMDSFSKWPEVNKLEKVNEKTVSQFCLRLIARSVK